MQILDFYFLQSFSIITFGSLVKNCNHKGLGIYYLLSAFIFGISGTLISVLLRIELYSSGNRIISPENQNFYNISITLHGFIMIFFLVMPSLFGGFGNYFVPIFLGSAEVVYPRVNNLSIFILPISYLLVILSLCTEFGGGTGWTRARPASCLPADGPINNPSPSRYTVVDGEPSAGGEAGVARPCLTPLWLRPPFRKLLRMQPSQRFG